MRISEKNKLSNRYAGSGPFEGMSTLATSQQNYLTTHVLHAQEG